MVVKKEVKESKTAETKQEVEPVRGRRGRASKEPAEETHVETEVAEKEVGGSKKAETKVEVEAVRGRRGRASKETVEEVNDEKHVPKGKKGKAAIKEEAESVADEAENEAQETEKKVVGKGKGVGKKSGLKKTEETAPEPVVEPEEQVTGRRATRGKLPARFEDSPEKVAKKAPAKHEKKGASNKAETSSISETLAKLQPKVKLERSETIDSNSRRTSARGRQRDATVQEATTSRSTRGKVHDKQETEVKVESKPPTGRGRRSKDPVVKQV